MINSEDLRFFYVIATHPSLTAAARDLDVTPPTVTQRLQGIEAKLSVKLVQRQARGIRLTEEGQLLLDKAKLILGEIDELQELMNSKRNQIGGRLKILAPLGFGNDYVAPLVGEFQRRHENLSVELALSDDPNWADSHQWDMIIYIGELRDSSLKLVSLAPNRRFLCASPGYLQRMGTPQSPKDLRNHTCIALRENSEDVTLWRFTHSTTAEQESVRIIPRLASNEGRVVKDWAMADHGIIMRSEWDVTPELNSGELVRLLPDYELPGADIVALLGTDARARSARTVKFLDLLKERFSNQPWLKLNQQTRSMP